MFFKEGNGGGVRLCVCVCRCAIPNKKIDQITYVTFNLNAGFIGSHINS